MSLSWDPEHYLRYGNERSRAFLDLLARVEVDAASIADLGCGPGHLTEVLRDRWPQAEIVGIDSSPQMIERAVTGSRDPGVTYQVGDVRDWRPSHQVDLLISNATFQWVPGHIDLLPTLADQVAPGGAFAFSVPGNYAAPSHQILRALTAEHPYAPHVPDERPAALDASEYLAALSAPGWRIDAWETTYLHVLVGADPVFEWISATGARPVLQALPADLVGAFTDELKARLRAAYPAQAFGTVLAFRRVFVVAHRSGSYGSGSYGGGSYGGGS